VADDRDRRGPGDPTCPMCRRPVVAGMPALAEHGDVMHLDCDLGLMDAAAAVARLLRARPGHALCTACIAGALGLTVPEAQAGSARLRALRGFAVRFARCVSCRSRRQVVGALRGPAGTARDSRTA
jgi:hypothetical protein